MTTEARPLASLPFTTAAWLLACGLLMSACPLRNEGAVDLRKANYQAPPPIETDKCEGAKLLNKNMALAAPDSLIKPLDSVSVHLKSAYIKDFAESMNINPYHLFDRRKTDAIGEIAVVSNVFEVATGKELDMVDQKSGRLVFYSNDVRKRQHLNFSNMPMYGPIQFNGAPLAFRITIFELDVDSEQMKAVLATLAEIGAKAYPPASPALPILNATGESLLSGDQNDVEFRYTMYLDPLGGYSKVNHFVLEAANYVLVRSEERDIRIPWEKLSLDENTGRLWIKDASGCRPFTDESYVVVEVNKNVSSAQIDLKENSFSDLLVALEAEDKAKADRIRGISPSLRNAVNQRSQLARFDGAKAALDQMEQLQAAIDKPTPSASQHPEQAARVARDRPLWRAEQQVLIEGVLDTMKGAIDSNGRIKTASTDGKTQPTLSRTQVDYLLRRLRSATGDPSIRASSVGSKSASAFATALLPKL